MPMKSYKLRGTVILNSKIIGAIEICQPGESELRESQSSHSHSRLYCGSVVNRPWMTESLSDMIFLDNSPLHLNRYPIRPHNHRRATGNDGPRRERQPNPRPA